MFEALFSGGIAVGFFLAFLIVLGLIGVTAWAVRRFGGGRMGSATLRGRQPRLAVIDYASVDARRRLILVRRDNVEHLVMIGGPTDVVVESNIVRAAPATRETGRTPAGADMLPRALPPESGNGTWPLQPESTAASRPVPRHDAEEPHAPEPPRGPRESLAALAEEIAPRPAPPPRLRPAPPPARAEPRMPAPQPVDPATDQNLAEMAYRLEAALRKPKSVPAPEPPDPRHTAAPRVAPSISEPPEEPDTAAPPLPPPRAVRAAAEQPRSPRAEAKPAPSKTVYDSLEQEMASLLGRPAGKG
jgi:hypothetical protein